MRNKYQIGLFIVLSLMQLPLFSTSLEMVSKGSSAHSSQLRVLQKVYSSIRPDVYITESNYQTSLKSLEKLHMDTTKEGKIYTSTARLSDTLLPTFIGKMKSDLMKISSLQKTYAESNNLTPQKKITLIETIIPILKTFQNDKFIAIALGAEPGDLYYPGLSETVWLIEEEKILINQHNELKNLSAQLTGKALQKNNAFLATNNEQLAQMKERRKQARQVQLYMAGKESQALCESLMLPALNLPLNSDSQIQDYCTYLSNLDSNWDKLNKSTDATYSYFFDNTKKEVQRKITIEDKAFSQLEYKKEDCQTNLTPTLQALRERKKEKDLMETYRTQIWNYRVKMLKAAIVKHYSQYTNDALSVLRTIDEIAQSQNGYIETPFVTVSTSYNSEKYQFEGIYQFSINESVLRYDFELSLNNISIHEYPKNMKSLSSKGLEIYKQDVNKINTSLFSQNDFTTIHLALDVTIAQDLKKITLTSTDFTMMSHEQNKEIDIFTTPLSNQAIVAFDYLFTYPTDTVPSPTFLDLTPENHSFYTRVTGK